MLPPWSLCRLCICVSQFASARPVASGAGGGPDIYDRLNDKYVAHHFSMP